MASENILEEMIQTVAEKEGKDDIVQKKRRFYKPTNQVSRDVHVPISDSFGYSRTHALTKQ